MVVLSGFTALISAFPKCKAMGNVNSEPPLHVFEYLTTPMLLSVHEGLLSRSSQWLSSQTCLVWGNVTLKLLYSGGSSGHCLEWTSARKIMALRGGEVGQEIRKQLV